jgi:biuret amidohydrolase
MATRGPGAMNMTPAIGAAALETGFEYVKKRYNCFLATDLDFVLRNTLGANTLLITGVNTNSCVLTTTIAAQTMDYAAIVISECVDTCDGPEFHAKALSIIERAFGWVMTGDEALRVVAGERMLQHATARE